MKKIKKYIIGLLVLALCIGIGVRIYIVNRSVPKVIDRYYQIGDTVPFEDDLFYTTSMDGYSLKVISAEVKTTEQFIEEYGAKREDILDSHYSSKVYDLEVEIANADKGYKDISIAVRPGTSVTMHLIFGLPDQTLSRWAFEHIEDLDLKLVISLYPEKKMIELT